MVLGMRLYWTPRTRWRANPQTPQDPTVTPIIFGTSVPWTGPQAPNTLPTNLNRAIYRKEACERKVDYLAVKSVAMGYFPVEPDGCDCVCGRGWMFVYYSHRRLYGATLPQPPGGLAMVVIDKAQLMFVLTNRGLVF